MKLEGSLDAFGLPDIFQLLSLTKKTGGLQLRSGMSGGVVYFAGGSITGAESDLSRQTLARRVVGSGTVPDTALSAAIKRALADGVGVSRALVDAGAVDADLVRDAATEVACDAISDLLAWTEGDFAFSVDAENPDDVGVVLSTDAVVSQSGARQDALAAASDAIPSTDVVLVVPVVLADDPELSREEWALLALADGHRDVAELIDLTGRGSFAVLPALATLVRRGLLEVKGDDVDPVEEMRQRLELLAPLEAAASARPAEAVRKPAAASTASTASTAAPAAPAPSAVAADSSPVTQEPADEAESALASTIVSTIGGPHVPTDVVPPRPEPFLAKRQPEHPEAAPETAAAPAPGRLAFAPSPARAEAEAPVAAATGGSVFSQPVSAGASNDIPRSSGASSSARVGGVNGSAAMAADPETAALIERDPSVNRSLLLRLIAGVRGL